MKRRYGRDFMPRTVSSLFKLLFIGLHNRPALPYNEKKSRGEWQCGEQMKAENSKKIYRNQWQKESFS